ncbi:MAG: chalcone isomerase family protein [Polyangiaceae bacterium]
MKKSSAFVSAILALAVSLPALALEKGADGFYMTGGGTRVKKVIIKNFDVYDVWHYMKELPGEKSRAAVIAADVDKKLLWKMKRDVDAEKIKNALSEAYGINGCGGDARIGKLLGAVGHDLKENEYVTIKYDAASKSTSLSLSGGGAASAPGADFMKCTWSIWFGKMPDQQSLGDQLISKL